MSTTMTTAPSAAIRFCRRRTDTGRGSCYEDYFPFELAHGLDLVREIVSPYLRYNSVAIFVKNERIANALGDAAEDENGHG